MRGLPSGADPWQKADAIAKEVGSNEELIKVLLEQLIKKEFVKKEGDVYHYLP